MNMYYIIIVLPALAKTVKTSQKMRQAKQVLT